MRRGNGSDTTSALVNLQVLLCIVNITAMAIDSRGCNPGWIFQGTSCYQSFAKSVTWHKARHACEALGSHLVTFGTSEENEFVYQSLAKNKTLWIGLYRNPVDFHWLTQETLSYQNWIVAPNTDDVSEKCVEITDYSEFHGEWNDNQCIFTQGYICEQDQYLHGDFKIKRGVSLSDHVTMEPSAPTDTDCVLQCLRVAECKSVNFYTDSSPGLCQLNNATSTEFPDDLVEEDHVAYYERIGV